MTKFALLAVALLLLCSCEEVVDIPLETEPPRLVVDALIGCNNTVEPPITVGQITLTQTGSFLNAQVNPALNAQVSITNTITQEVYSLTEEEPGIFTQGFPPLEFGVPYTLTIIYNGEIYTATQQLMPTGTITKLSQGDGFLFDKENETEIIVTFDDLKDQRNYYMLAFGFDNYLVTDDEFYQNSNLTFSYYYDDINPGEELTITLFGINQQFGTYVDQALVLSGEDGPGGPFATPVGTLKGNIINTTNANNYPLGYFALGAFDAQTITVE